MRDFLVVFSFFFSFSLFLSLKTVFVIGGREESGNLATSFRQLAQTEWVETAVTIRSFFFVFFLQGQYCSPNQPVSNILTSSPPFRDLFKDFSIVFSLSYGG